MFVYELISRSSGSNLSTFEFNNVIVELDVGQSPTQIQSMQLHKLLDINEEKKPNETKYEVSMMLKYILVDFHFK